MSKKYHIKTLGDFRALSPEQRKRCAVDLLVWADFADRIIAATPGLFVNPSEMIWIDDDRIGEVSGVLLSDSDGKEISYVDIPKVAK